MQANRKKVERSAAGSMKTPPLQVTQEIHTACLSKMEALASEYDLLCQISEAVGDEENPCVHLLNNIDRRLPAIEVVLATSEPRTVNDLLIFAVMIRDKLASLRDNAGFLIHPEKYGKPVTFEDLRKIAPDVRSNIRDLQAMITIMIDSCERISGMTAKKLGIGRIAAANDFSDE
jgi:hypothetical protein